MDAQCFEQRPPCAEEGHCQEQPRQFMAVDWATDRDWSVYYWLTPIGGVHWTLEKVED